MNDRFSAVDYHLSLCRFISIRLFHVFITFIKCMTIFIAICVFPTSIKHIPIYIYLYIVSINFFVINDTGFKEEDDKEEGSNKRRWRI